MNKIGSHCAYNNNKRCTQRTWLMYLCRWATGEKKKNQDKGIQQHFVVLEFKMISNGCRSKCIRFHHNNFYPIQQWNRNLERSKNYYQNPTASHPIYCYQSRNFNATPVNVFGQRNCQHFTSISWAQSMWHYLTICICNLHSTKRHNVRTQNKWRCNNNKMPHSYDEVTTIKGAID